MKTLVNSLATAVHRFPLVVVVVIVIISMALGILSGNFQPEEDSNESFAPDAPELEAVDTISDLFGEESTGSVMQIIIRSATDVITTDGLAAVTAAEEAVRTGTFQDILVDLPERPAVVSFMFPVESAIEMGSAPPDMNDAVLKQVYAQSLTELPPEQSGFATQLLPGDVDPTSAISDVGLMIVFTTGAASSDEFDQFVDDSAIVAEEIRNAPMPPGISAEPFSFELLFADQDEFTDEILRMLTAAVFIILTVLALVFYVAPRLGRNRIFGVGGFAALIAITALLVLDSIPDIELGSFTISPALSVLIVFGAVFLIWTFVSKNLRRTSADTLLTIVTIFFAVSWMNGIGYLLYEEANPMAQIIPILLIGLGVDYSIHISSRYREEVSDSGDVDQSIDTAIKTVGVALVLATVTTAAGFLTNIFNDLPALREFGVLAAVGIGASFILMLTFVPAVRELVDRRGARRETLEPEILKGTQSRLLPRIAGQTSWLARKVPAVVVAVAVVLAGVGVFGWSQLEAKFSFLDFIPTTSPLRSTFETLLVRFGGGFGEQTQVLIEGDVATAGAWNGMVAANADMAETPNVVLFAGQPQANSPLSVIGPMLQQEAPTFNPQVAEAAQALGMSEQFTVTSDVGPLYEAAFAVAPAEMARVVSVAGDGRYQAALFDITTQAGEAGAGQLSIDLNANFEPVRAAGTETVATSNEIINDVIVTTLRDSQTLSLILTLLVALGVLVLNFWVEARRPILGALTTLPVFLVVLLTFAYMAARGIPYGPVTATIAALSIGIGIPYMIHITHRYLEDRTRFDTGEEAIESTLTHTGGALFGSALTTIAGFGILVTSTTIPFQQLGEVTAVAIAFALLSATLILPSMLALWDRYHRRRGEVVIDVTAVEEALQLHGGAD